MNAAGKGRLWIKGACRAVAVAMFAVAMPGCLGPLAWNEDSWCDNKAQGNDWISRRESSLVSHVEVAPERQAEAQNLLTASTFVVLSEERARELAGRDVPGGATDRIYLIRAVYLYEGTGKFEVYSDGRQVAAVHHCLGAFPAWKMTRRALIVRLPRPPERVWVYCGMAA